MTRRAVRRSRDRRGPAGLQATLTLGPGAPEGADGRLRRLSQRPGRTHAQRGHPRRHAAGRVPRRRPQGAGGVRHRDDARRHGHLGGRTRSDRGRLRRGTRRRGGPDARCRARDRRGRHAARQARARTRCSARWWRTARSATATSSPARHVGILGVAGAGHLPGLVGPIASRVTVFTDGEELTADLAAGVAVRTDRVTGVCPSPLGATISFADGRPRTSPGCSSRRRSRSARRSPSSSASR